MKPRAAWTWAMLLAVPGVLLLAGANHGSLSVLGRAPAGAPAVAALLALWAVYLVVARGAYWAFNAVDVGGRRLLYLGLQLLRTLGYALLVSTTLVGAMALVALAVARWMPYLTYREVGIHWRSSYRPLLLVLFLTMGAAATASNHRDFIGLQAALFVGWLVVLARKELKPAFGGRLDAPVGRR